jgi:hypothetical protein
MGLKVNEYVRDEWHTSKKYTKLNVLSNARGTQDTIAVLSG